MTEQKNELVEWFEKMLTFLYVQASLDVMDKRNEGQGKALCKKRVEKMSKDIVEKLEVDEEKIREMLECKEIIEAGFPNEVDLAKAISDEKPIRIREEEKDCLLEPDCECEDCQKERDVWQAGKR